MQQHEVYCETYLEQWDAMANVRRNGRYRAAPGSSCDAMINPDVVPYLKHPEVAALGAEARQFLLVQKCYDMLLLLADHETEMVVRVCLDLAASDSPILTAKPVRKALLSVSTDESYHALVAEEDIEQLERLSGIALLPTVEEHAGITAAIAALQRAQALCDEATRPALALFVIALMENATTEELAELMRYNGRGSPFFEITRQHLRDEARHRILFRQLMRGTWAALNEDQRSEVARAIPLALDGYMTAMLQTDLPVHKARLRHLGLAADEANAVLASLPGLPPARVNPLWLNMCACIAEIGLGEDPHLGPVFTLAPQASAVCNAA